MLAKLTDFLSTIIPAPEVQPHPEQTLQLAIAVLLIEVMRSDSESPAEEQATIRKILMERFLLSEGEVAQLMERGLRTSRSATDFHRFTSLINNELGLAGKIQIVEYMWRVVYADGKVSAHENHIMRKLVDLLHISHGDNIAAKMRAKPAGVE